jgi:hypothetical protein
MTPLETPAQSVLECTQGRQPMRRDVRPPLNQTPACRSMPDRLVYNPTNRLSLLTVPNLESAPERQLKSGMPDLVLLTKRSTVNNVRGGIHEKNTNSVVGTFSISPTLKIFLLAGDELGSSDRGKRLFLVGSPQRSLDHRHVRSKRIGKRNRRILGGL